MSKTVKSSFNQDLGNIEPESSNNKTQNEEAGRGTRKQTRLVKGQIYDQMIGKNTTDLSEGGQDGKPSKSPKQNERKTRRKIVFNEEQVIKKIKTNESNNTSNVKTNARVKQNISQKVTTHDKDSSKTMVSSSKQRKIIDPCFKNVWRREMQAQKGRKDESYKASTLE